MWLSGRASPCQGEGRGFESRHPLGSAHIGRSGGVAERRGKGLQIPVHGFKSRLHLVSAQRVSEVKTKHPFHNGRLAQLASALP